MKRTTMFVLVGLLLATVVGCGTVRGIGDDISTVGHWLTRGSDKAATK